MVIYYIDNFNLFRLIKKLENLKFGCIMTNQLEDQKEKQLLHMMMLILQIVPSHGLMVCIMQFFFIFYILFIYSLVNILPILGKSFNGSTISVQLATKRDNWQGGRGGGSTGGGGSRGGSGRGRGGYGGYQMDDPVSDDPSDGGFYGGPRGWTLYLLIFYNTILIF